MEAFCERGNEPSDCISCWKVIERLQKWPLLKKDSAPWVWVDGSVILLRSERRDGIASIGISRQNNELTGTWRDQS
jgi:hypothetical protein